MKTLSSSLLCGTTLSCLLAMILPAVSIAAPVADLQIGKSGNRLKGDGVYNKRKASNKQTLVQSKRIFVTNTATAHLLMQNDGDTADKLTLKSNGDQRSGMKVSAFDISNGRKNITAALKHKGYTATVPAGGAVRVIYQLKTNRYYAGVENGGNRNDTVDFRLSGGGSRDRAAMVVKYSEPAGPPRL